MARRMMKSKMSIKIGILNGSTTVEPFSLPFLPLFVKLSSHMTEEKKINSERIDEMFKAGAHFGYSKTRRHASVAPYIFGVKNQVEIIDLEKTDALLEKALNFIAGLAKDGKQVLFVGGKNEARGALKIAAESIGMPFVDGRWIGGTLTNFTEIKKRLMKLEDLTKQKEKGELSKYTKKERLMIDREIANLERFFSGISSMKDLPKAVVVIDSKKEIIAVNEAKNMNIPVVSLCGTDCDITNINYPIVANDSAVSSITFFANEIAKGYQKAKVLKA
jgi:small subunit ribosomal protein S2